MKNIHSIVNVNDDDDSNTIQSGSLFHGKNSYKKPLGNRTQGLFLFKQQNYKVKEVNMKININIGSVKSIDAFGKAKCQFIIQEYNINYN